MTGLTINYFLHVEAEAAEVEGAEEELLGVERFEGIQEKLIPGYNEEGHKVSITKFFAGRDDHRWLVKYLVHVSDSETSVYLEAWKNNRREEFLSQTQKSNRSVISKLQFGTLVEVEFGFIPSVKKLNGDVRSNKRYPDTIHKGEMHKRRLCVVVKADSQRVQVVPVTSQAPGSFGDLSVCQISDASLADLIGYNDPAIPSYAICRMIKTVALTRVLPPISRQRGTRAAFRDHRYSKKLNGADRAAFKQALSHAVGLTDYCDLKEKVSEYYRELQVIKPENEILAKQMVRLMREKADFEAMAERYEVLLEIMTDWRMAAAGDSPEMARAYIEAEVTEYAAILNGD
ncbi:MAG: hypothetical protein AB7S62_13820 [Azoarcus sp.]